MSNKNQIRAASLSGDCDFWNEIRRGKVAFKDHHKTCVRRRAVVSLASHPNTTQEQAVEAVETVFKECYNDVSPFGCIP
jgi:mitochondrial inner membrane protease ATP23